MKTKQAIFMLTLLVVVALFASCLSSCGEPQEKAYLQGKVTEESTGMPLSNVTVYLNEIPYETASDAQFVFSELESGKIYKLKVSNQYYEDFEKDVVAVYPSANEEIKMKLKKSSPETLKNLQVPSIAQLKSYDFEINFGLSEKEVTIMENGTFVAPDSYKLEMQTPKRDQLPAMPGSADENVQDKKPEFDVTKSIEIGKRQWVDDGKGWKLNERYHPGFRDIYQIVNINILNISDSIRNPMFISDEGSTTLYGHEVKRFKGISIIEVPYEENPAEKEKQFIEFSVAIVSSGEFSGVPIETTVSTYKSKRQVKTWAKVILSNLNVSTNINPPLK